MAKDRVKALFAAINQGDTGTIRDEANRILKEIDSEQKALKRDQALVRDLLNRYGGPADNMASSERSAKVRAAALALAAKGAKVLSSQDVIDYLQREEGIEFAIEKPTSMAGSVLSQMKEFTKVATNRFRFDAEAHRNGAKRSDL